MRLLAKFIHGSHLYKLNTETSDEDYKGVYLPELEDILLGDIKDTINLSTNKSNNKNSSDDIDYEVYSLHKWVKLLSKGEMVCFDMLFAPDEAVTYYNKSSQQISTYVALSEQNPVAVIRERFRGMFVHADMKAYLGYCRRQAAKYGIKGSRLDSLFLVKECLQQYPFDPTERLDKNYYVFPKNEFLKVEKDHYEVLGKKHQWTTYLTEFQKRIDSEIERYGHRAKLAQQNEGIDWKAISHAFRAGYQIESMLRTGHMDVVLDHDIREYILKVKQGQSHWGSVKNHLEELMDKVESFAERNPKGLQNKPDGDKINKLLISLIKRYYGI